MRAVIRGIGSYLPKRVMTNQEMSEMVETSDEWIQERTGIRKRRIAAEGEFTSDLGYEAALAALQHAGLTADDIDLIVVATSTPDLTFPSTATIIDGAGAIIVEAVEDTESGILQTYIRSDGRYRDMLYVDGGPSRTQTVGHLRMLGNQVFKHAVTDISKVIKDCAEQAGIEVADIDWFVPHQANQRILNAVAKRLKLRPGQVVSTVDQHANTSAASVPLAMDAAVKDGRIKKGDLVMLEAFGGGFTWGAALLRY